MNDTIEIKKYRNFKHGFGMENKTYRAWTNIKKRCLNPNALNYHKYGGKGITVHPSFENDFLAFYKEIGDAPNDGRRWSVDRIDNTKNYEPNNLRWATNVQQARNRGVRKNNTSNSTGVNWTTKFNNDNTTTTYVVSHWSEYKDGVSVSKKKLFSVKKLGLLEAFAAACEYRETKIKELNDLGYGYADNHGK